MRPRGPLHRPTLRPGAVPAAPHRRGRAPHLPAFSARVYSLAFSNGCSEGSRLRCTCNASSGARVGGRAAERPSRAEQQPAGGRGGAGMPPCLLAAALGKGPHLLHVLRALPRRRLLRPVDRLDLHAARWLPGALQQDRQGSGTRLGRRQQGLGGRQQRRQAVAAGDAAAQCGSVLNRSGAFPGRHAAP